MTFILRIQQFRKNFAKRGPVFFRSFCAIVLFSLFSQTIYGEFGSIVDVGLGGDFYFTRESANNGQGFVNLLIQNKWSNSKLWFDVGAGGLVGENAASYIKAPQFFYRIGQKGESYFTIGRAIHPWSFSDDYWNLGVTQPNFRWDEARPEIQGLVGFFGTIPLVKNKLEFTALYSPLFIPSQGPSYELINGNLTATNPWFSEPVEVLNFSGRKVDLNYQIDIPKAQEVILQDTFAAQISTPRNKKDGLFNLFVMDKPRNDLVLPFTGQLNLSTQNGDITVFPRVPRHTVYGADIGWNFKSAKTVLSYMHESDVRYEAPEGSLYPVIPEQDIYSATQIIRLTKAHKLSLGYIRTDREPNELAGNTNGSQISAFAKRNRFDEAFRLKWMGLMFRSKSLYLVRTSFAFNQSLVRDNIWLSADVRWSIHKGVEAFTKCDFFGGKEETIVGQDFMSTYLNNDRCFVGAHYAF